MVQEMYYQIVIVLINIMWIISKLLKYSRIWKNVQLLLLMYRYVEMSIDIFQQWPALWYIHLQSWILNLCSSLNHNVVNFKRKNVFWGFFLWFSYNLHLYSKWSHLNYATYTYSVQLNRCQIECSLIYKDVFNNFFES